MRADTGFLRAAEIARLKGVSLRTVRRWIASGVLPSAKVGGVRLVAKREVDRLLSPALGNVDSVLHDGVWNAQSNFGKASYE